MPPEQPRQEQVCYNKRDFELSKEHNEQPVSSVMTANGAIPVQ